MQYRAKEAINDIIQQKSELFVYFDGHGRLTYAILSYLKDINRLDILSHLSTNGTLCFFQKRYFVLKGIYTIYLSVRRPMCMVITVELVVMMD